MKIVIILVFIFTISCEKTSPPMTQYHMTLRLVDGTMINDSFSLIDGTKLQIDQYQGSYGLRVTYDSWSNIYGAKVMHVSEGFLRFGVIDFKIDSIVTDPYSPKNQTP